MSQSDAAFMAERYRSDTVVLATEEKELVSLFFEKLLL
jgi:hypothetical protein